MYDRLMERLDEAANQTGDLFYFRLYSGRGGKFHIALHAVNDSDDGRLGLWNAATRALALEECYDGLEKAFQEHGHEVKF